MLKKVFRILFCLCGVLLGYGLSTWALNEPSVAQKVSFLGTGGRIAAVIVAALLFGIIFFYYPFIWAL